MKWIRCFIAAMSLWLLQGLPGAIKWDQVASASSYYKGKTIRMVSPWSPAGSPDTAARLYAKYLAKFIPGEPRFIVWNVPGGRGILGTNHLYSAAKRDGLTVGVVEPPLVINQLSGEGGIKYDMAKFVYIGSLARQTQLALLRGELPYATIERARAAKKRIFAAARRIGSSDYVGARAIEAIGVPVEIVPGYAGSSEIILALEKGEVDLHVTSVDSIHQRRPGWLERGGPFHHLVAFGFMRPEVSHVPNIRGFAPLAGKEGIVKAADLLAKTPRRLLVAPPGTPKEVVDILKKGFKLMVGDKAFVAEATRLGIVVEPLIGEEIREIIEEFVGSAIIKEAVPKLVQK